MDNNPKGKSEPLKKVMLIFMGIFLVFFPVKLVTYICYLVLAILLVISLVKKPIEIKSLMKNPIFFPALAMFFWSLLSILWTPEIGTWVEEIEKDLYFIVFFASVLFLLKDTEKYKFWVKLALIGLAFSLVFGLYEHLFIATRARYRVASFFGNPNIFAAVIVLLVPLLLALFLDAKEKWKLRLPAIVFFILGIFVLTQTMTRSAWIALPVGLIIVFLLRNWKVAVTGITIFVLVISLIYPIIPGHLISRAESIFNPEDNTARITIWRISAKMIADNLIIGSGRGSFKPVYDEYSDLYPELYFQRSRAPNINHSHNLFIQILIEMGLVGFSLFLLLIYFLVKSSVSFFKKNRGSYWLVAGIFGGLASLFVHLQFHFTVFNRSLTMIILFFLALIFWGGKPEEETEIETTG